MDSAPKPQSLHFSSEKKTAWAVKSIDIVVGLIGSRPANPKAGCRRIASSRKHDHFYRITKLKATGDNKKPSEFATRIFTL